MNYQQLIAELRESMIRHNIGAYIIPSADPHMSEYVPEYYKQIRLISGFTGSMGTIVITHDFVGLWTDFRYFQQAEQELAQSGVELVKLKVQHQPEYIEWLSNHLPQGSVVAFDFRLLSIVLVQQIEAGLLDKKIKISNIDLISSLWVNRPQLPSNPAFLLNEADCGFNPFQKLQQLRSKLKQQKVDTLILSALDEIAWLFNMRGADVTFNPVVLAFAIVSLKEVKLFVPDGKVSTTDVAHLNAAGVNVLNYDAFEHHLKDFPLPSQVLIDPKKNNHLVKALLPQSVKLKLEDSPISLMKSVKNTTEQQHTRLAMRRDGVAITRFFKWLEENINQGNITEWSAALQINQFRAEQEGYVGPSFSPISAYGPHAAMPHYSPGESHEVKLQAKGLYLLDSGGHYFHGTTDITRTVALGEVTDQEKTDYTLVLSAMISGSMAKFPKGTRGYQIDGICRQQMWEHGINYGHGTGHGVGYFLNVHEGPQNIGPSNVATPIEPGMLTSMEPGIYRPGKHGIRIENLILAIADHTTEFGEFLAFETFTFAHIDTSILIKELLTQHQINWLNQYHDEVYQQLSPLLNDDEKNWLLEKCKAI